MRIGIIGVGRIGAFHAGVLSAHPGVEEVLLADVDGGRAAEVAERCGAHVVDGVERVLGAADAVVITAPTSEHAELILGAVDAGLPAFCEKPIAIDLESTRAVVAAV